MAREAPAAAAVAAGINRYSSLCRHFSRNLPEQRENPARNQLSQPNDATATDNLHGALLLRAGPQQQQPPMARAPLQPRQWAGGHG